MGEMTQKIDAKNSSRTKNKGERSAEVSETRKKILDVASKLFREKGYAATTLRQIGEAAGMQAGSVYYHFDSKDDMICEILDLGITYVHQEVKKRISELGEGASARAKLEAAVDGHLFDLLSHGDFVSANIRNYGQLPDKLRARNHAVREAYVSYWDALLVDAQKSGDIRKDIDVKILRLFAVGSLNWTAEWFDSKKGSIEDLSEEIKKVIFEGVGTNGSA